MAAFLIRSEAKKGIDGGVVTVSDRMLMRRKEAKRITIKIIRKKIRKETQSDLFREKREKKRDRDRVCRVIYHCQGEKGNFSGVRTQLLRRTRTPILLFDSVNLSKRP
ncbi:hypothetical protein JTE90_021953 [Oedothorax gibbosus]|uniref:Uncharacterized protein n=1 Tax=Oedothorax gibbosus TaxID=931172 RepID=A0AAV6V5N8_9ARAC|nr:hypothetical protein JTE90_021953 [Oedothorax gibbosus]